MWTFLIAGMLFSVIGLALLGAYLDVKEKNKK
jgi:hypothetical protein